MNVSLMFKLLGSAGQCNQGNNGAVTSKYCGSFLNPLASQKFNAPICGKKCMAIS